MSEFKDVFKKLRISKNLSQRELAKKLDISASSIGMYETGSRYPSREQEQAIANYFKVDLKTLRGDDDSFSVSVKYSAESAELLNTVNSDFELRDMILDYLALSERQKKSVREIVKSMRPDQ